MVTLECANPEIECGQTQHNLTFLHVFSQKGVAMLKLTPIDASKYPQHVINTIITA